MCRFSLIALSFLIYEQQVFTYTFDQRQTGELNVQVDLKNLNIIALMKGKEDYVDYDYAYDYSDITIKPENGTTKRPLNVTEATTQPFKGNDTTTTPPESITISNLNVSSTTLPSLNVENAVTTTLGEIKTDEDIKADNTTPVPTRAVTMQSTDAAIIGSTSAPLDNCKKGFFRNVQGLCELRLQNPSNTLLKMIKQKPKASGGNQSRHP